MKHLFAPYDIAKQLKEKGFNYEVMATYNNDKMLKHFDYKIRASSDLLAPLYQQVIDWFREKHNIHIEICCGHDEDSIWWNGYLFNVIKDYKYDAINKEDIADDNYYLCLNKSIEEALKLI